METPVIAKKKKKVYPKFTLAICYKCGCKNIITLANNDDEYCTSCNTMLK